MTDWWSYRPSDFLLFSPTTYWRLFELENAAVWPLPLVTLLAGLAVLGFTFRPPTWSGRPLALLFGRAWAWVGWSFLWQRYAPINWTAGYVAPLFALQALIFVWIAAARAGCRLGTRFTLSALPGSLLLGYAVILHPLTALLAGRPLAGAEIVGIAPDPTAIATVGLALLMPPGVERWLLLIVPSLWLSASAVTLLTLSTWEGWVPIAVLGLTLFTVRRSPAA